jgi:hypothetical protein
MVVVVGVVVVRVGLGLGRGKRGERRGEWVGGGGEMKHIV